MKQLSRCSAVLFALSLLALSTGPAPALIRPFDGGGGGINFSGFYSGSVTDSVLGSGTAVANLAASGGTGGDPLGGWMSFTFGSATYNNPTAAAPRGQGDGGGGDGGYIRFMDGGGSNMIHGRFVMIIGSVACTFHYIAGFTTSTSTLNGTYKAVNGCSGQNGTFSLLQQCYYQQIGHNGQGEFRRRGGSGPGLCT